jgi:hypothetical protein
MSQLGFITVGLFYVTRVIAFSLYLWQLRDRDGGRWTGAGVLQGFGSDQYAIYHIRYNEFQNSSS